MTMTMTTSPATMTAMMTTSPATTTTTTMTTTAQHRRVMPRMRRVGVRGGRSSGRSGGGWRSQCTASPGTANVDPARPPSVTLRVRVSQPAPPRSWRPKLGAAGWTRSTDSAAPNHPSRTLPRVRDRVPPSTLPAVEANDRYRHERADATLRTNATRSVVRLSERGPLIRAIVRRGSSVLLGVVRLWVSITTDQPAYRSTKVPLCRSPSVDVGPHQPHGGRDQWRR